MEAMEDTTLEPAIGWLADTILANLKLARDWIRQAGLGNDVEKLKSEVEAVEMVVSAVQGRAAGNKPLTRSLAAVKELLYDADDMVDELDHCWLQQELQPETLLETDGHGTHQVERSSENADDVQGSSNGRLRSKAWIHFDITKREQNGGPAKAKCKRCQTELMCETKKGTSVLRNHLKSKGCAKKRGASDPSSRKNLPKALISGGIFKAAAALCLIFFQGPGGVFLHHGKAPYYLYYGILVVIVVFGLMEASVGCWVSGRLDDRHAAGKAVLCVSILPLICMAAFGGFIVLRKVN